MVLPWVSTFGGTHCGTITIGPRLQSVIDPGALALARDGRLFFSQYSRQILLVENDQISLFAGGDHPLQETDGPALVATFLEPIKDLAVGTQGELYVAQAWGIRMIRGGQVTTVAGKPDEYVHVDGPGGSARFITVQAIDVTPDGALSISDSHYLRQLRDGVVSTIAGTGEPIPAPLGPKDGPVQTATIGSSKGLVVAGNTHYFADSTLVRRLQSDEIRTISGHFMPKTCFLDGPVDQACFGLDLRSLAEHQGTLYVNDRQNNRIRVVANGMVTSLNNGKIGLKDGQLAEAEFEQPSSIVTDGQGNLYVSDACRIRYIRFR